MNRGQDMEGVQNAWYLLFTYFSMEKSRAEDAVTSSARDFYSTVSGTISSRRKVS